MFDFKEKFDRSACAGDSIDCEIDGVTYSARIERDDDTDIDDDDSHNTEQFVTGANDARYRKMVKARAAYKRGEWFYCGIVLSAVNADGWTQDHLASLWAVECNYPGSRNTYLTEVANDLLREIIS